MRWQLLGPWPESWIARPHLTSAGADPHRSGFRRTSWFSWSTMAVWEAAAELFEVMFTMALTAFRSPGRYRRPRDGHGRAAGFHQHFSGPRVTAITSIGMDHQQFLGYDLRSRWGKGGHPQGGRLCARHPAAGGPPALEQSLGWGGGPRWIARCRCCEGPGGWPANGSWPVASSS